MKLSNSVRRAIQWNGKVLIPLYHPGQRAMIHRSFLNQLADYQFVAETFRRLVKRGGNKKPPQRVDEIVQYCVRALLRRAGTLPYFQLHKLFYLIEYSHYRSTGERLSRAYIIRQKDGPYITALHAGSLRRSMTDLDIKQLGSELLFRLRKRDVDLFTSEAGSILDDELESLVDGVWRRYGSASKEELKTAVYMTSPMRKLLRAEKYAKRSTFNQPVEFG